MNDKPLLNKSLTQFAKVAALSLIFVSPIVSAIERPSALKNKPQPNQKEEKAKLQLPMLGVGGSPVSKTLSIHLGLEAGKGLTLFHIVPDSAAAKAGLQPHDIITSVDGELIGCQKSLRDAIIKHQPKDEITIAYIHKGKQLQKKVVLGELPKQLQAFRKRVPGMNPRWMFQGMGGQIPENDRLKLADQMLLHMGQLQEKLQKQGMMEFNIPNDLNMAIPKEGNMFKKAQGFHFSSSITKSDEKGSVTMKTANGKKEVVAKDKQGKIVFEGPYDTPQDKASVPDDIKDRIDSLNLKQNKAGFKLRILPGGKIEKAPLPNEDEDAQ